MKKLIPFLISSVLVIGAVGCENGVEKTSADAPNTTNETAGQTQADAPNTTNETAEAPTAEAAQESQNDATSEVRRDQLNADIRAREQRNNITGGDAIRADADLESEVRSKLEANLPASQLAVEAEEGAVTVSGTVPTDEQLQRVEPLAKEIKGVQSVKVDVTVAPAQPQ